MPAAGTPALPAAWSDVAPGLRWRRASFVEEARTLDWLVVRLDLAQVTPRAERVPDDRLAGLAGDPHVRFAVDAGFFDDDMTPTGLLSSGTTEFSAVDPRGGSGIVVLRGARAELLDASVPFARDARVSLAVQCGPRLVERDGSVGIRRDDGRRFARTALCLRDGGRIVDVVTTWWRDEPLRGPSLFSFSQRLASASPVGDERGCEAALNLDGGPSTGVYVRGASLASHEPIGPVPYAITLRD